MGSTCVTVIEGQPAFYTGSDGRFKTNLSEEDVKGIEFIKLLRPVVYNFDTKKFEEFLSKNMPDSIKKISMSQDFSSSTALRRTGFIAQEVEKAAKDVNFNFDGVHKPVDENDNYSLAYSQFVVPLVKAVQQQQKMIEDQSKENTDLKSQVTTLQKQMDALLNSKTGSTTGINQANAIGSEGFAMEQNIPNPFNGETTIKYTLPTSVNTAFMAVYDLTGKQITSFPVTEKGNASLTITSEKLAAGIYIYSIVADGKVIDSKRMIVAEK